MYKAIIDKALAVDARMFSLESEGRKHTLKAIPQDNGEPVICGTFRGDDDDVEEFWNDFQKARDQKAAEAEDEDPA